MPSPGIKKHKTRRGFFLRGEPSNCFHESTPFILDDFKCEDDNSIEYEANRLAAEKLKHHEILNFYCTIPWLVREYWIKSPPEIRSNKRKPILYELFTIFEP